MEKVTLINPKDPGSEWGHGRIPATFEDAQPRHSLTHLSAVLKRAGHEVSLIDLRTLQNWEEFDLLLSAQAPDFACVTGHTQEAGQALDCARRVKEIRPDCQTIAGGIHFTMFPEDAVDSSVIDFVIRGEGETSLAKLIQDPEEFEGISWGSTPDLDELPFEDRTLYRDYEERILFPVWDLPTPIVDLLTGRGCPWQCRFCCGPGEQNLYTRPSRRDPSKRSPHLRRRSVEHVMAEMAELRDRYHFRSMIFHDDQFLIERHWTEEFCDQMMSAGYPEQGVRWWAACRADMICRFPHIIEKMRDAGLSIISIGFESFSDPMLKWLDKGTTRQINMEAARICRSLGLAIYANVMFGTPRQDGRWYWDDDRETYRAIQEIQPAFLSPSYFSPIPGSWLYDWAVNSELMLDNASDSRGNRDPFQARIKGVDYSKLDSLVSDLSNRFSTPWTDRLRYYRFRAQRLFRKFRS